MADPPGGSSGEPALVRHAVEVPSGDAELALARLLDVFPDGLEEERVGDRVRLSGFLPAGEEPLWPAGVVGTASPVAPGWRDGWRAFHRPVRIGRFWVGPPWLEPDAGSDPIVIDPGQAFGTGAHGSTRAAATLLVDVPPGGPLLDLGCGSGVLSILAARLGFAPVTGVDVEKAAVEATRANAAVNGVAVRALRLDVLAEPLPPAAVALANLQLDLLAPLFERDGLPDTVLASGLLERETFAPAGWRVADRHVEDGWQALLLHRDPGAR
ncbi:MAG: Ribosomal protein L11 methyltransferase [uncultured Thermoleophilia bacterium]|uniref:Ribosomal protein L11 methyltransferase n=1 Tax=uncultured Thermoleophilia bacterium TaxID=1497501 RepID=A0A6J4TQ53_9ACTN|nr:MAG: Ribosomal protein L11 methyltransferase [uncultured Thermoleophilia bacterium]